MCVCVCLGVGGWLVECVCACLRVFVHVCVCVCVCVWEGGCLGVCAHVYVVYEDTNMYNDVGMTGITRRR